MKRFTKYATRKLIVGAALLAGAATIAAAPASAQVRFGVGGYAAPAPVCDPYSRFYDPYYCGAPYYGPAYGPVLSFGFGGRGGWGRDDFRGRGDFHGGGRTGGSRTGAGHTGGTGGRHR